MINKPLYYTSFQMKISFILYVLFYFFSINIVNGQQISTDSSEALEALIQANLGQGCVDISNISSNINGEINGISSYGSFDRDNSGFPFQNGIILSTGNIDSAGNSVITDPLNDGEDNWLTDSDLENALGITQTINATSIEFDFISVANQIQFNYLLASEEYNTNFPCQYSDGFAFLIKETGTSNPYSNIALIPGTAIPVNTNTIHDEIVGFCPAENQSFFEGYNIGDTNYNGRTTVLTATATIVPNVQYHIKLVIADQTDENYDSAVFIEGNSFNASVDLGPDIVTCGDSVLLNADIENNLASYEWFQNGTPISGATATTYEATSSGTYKVEITIQLNNTECVIEDDIEITLNTEQNSGVISDYLLCDDISNDGIETFDLSTKDYEVLISVPPSNYNITYHPTVADAQNGTNALPNIYQNTSNPQTIYIRIEDMDNGCLAFSTFNIIVNQVPDVIDPADVVVCDDTVSDGFTLIDLNPTSLEVTNGNPNLYVSYHYTQQDANSGANPVYSPYSNINSTETLFIRVYDATTGCVNTTSVNITVIDNPPVTQDDLWINACEQDFDGFADFDLTTVVASALQGLTGVTISFHENEADALTGNNPIADPENYQNVIPGLQIVYIRVVDDVTGCTSIVPIELHANIIQTGFSSNTFSVCDDVSEDGIEDFDLNEIETSLVNGYDEFTITFYETLNDQNNDTNPLDSNVPYTVSTNPAVIYATIVSDICTEYIEINLVIQPPIDIQGLGTVDYCDDDTDGFTTVFLDSFNAYVATGVNGANVRYFLTEQEAIDNEIVLAPYYYNSVNPFTIYVRVTNSQTGCFDIAPLEINVTSAPTVLQPSDIIVCDDDQDGISTVDLETRIPEIVTNTTGLNITFYNDYWNAYDAINVISDPESYTTATQYMYARVEDDNTGCFSLVGFYVYINTLPAFIPISNFENCEADGNQIADFFFYLKDTEILNGQPGKQVLYFETAQDAIDRINIIDKYSAYQNLSSPQTIHIRVENLTDLECFGTESFELEVGSLPLYNEPVDVFVCDDISNNGIEDFDLSEKLVEIALSIPETLSISFHNSYYEADYDLNELPLNYTNVTNPQQIFVRIENGTYCHAIVDFNINIIQVPEVSPAPDLIACDVDYDGSVVFNLTDVEVDILDVRQDNIEISYHESLTGAESDTEVIINTQNYSNTSNPQTVYVKINNTISDCYAVLPINLIVNLPPSVNDFLSHNICENTNNSFDLNTINNIVTNDLTNIIISYHSSQTDANNNLNPLPTNYTYTTNNDTIYIRLEHAITGCWTTYNFNLIVNPLPIANVPTTFLACDDISNNAIETIDLTLQNAQVLGAQSDMLFTVSYHIDETSANSNTNVLPSSYGASNGQTIYVRIENNSTGCYSTTLFDVLIYEHPQPAQPIVLCDADYDGFTTFDITQAESDLYPILPSYITISYFESETDLESGTNAIVSPSNYTNTTNPQTIFIKAYNTLADCYASVPLELMINLPPQINEFVTHEICDNATSSFNLNEIENVIVNDNTDVLFSYYQTLAEAQISSNPLNTDYTYSTISDTIFVRVEFGSTSCFYIYPFDLIINPLPVANQPSDLQTCDDDSNDGIGEFNLFSVNSTVLGSQDANAFTVAYFSTIADANDDTNPLTFNYIGQNGETVFVRIENNTTGCYSLTQFNLIVNEHPNVPSLIVNCDTDYDSNTPFDLTQAESELFNSVNPDNSITYFESIDDLQNDVNQIINPTNYINSSSPQTVFIKVFNTVANCFTFVPLELDVNLPPAIDPLDEFELCENENGRATLSEINSPLLIQTANVIVVYYPTEQDAINQTNALDYDYEYQSNSDFIFARVEFSTTHCYHIHEFNLIVNPSPIANTPNDLVECDDDYDGLYYFDLALQNPTVLNGQNPNNFSVTYYNDLIAAEEGINSIGEIYESQNAETIFVRVENNTTGCYNMTSFEIIINPKPILDIGSQVICLEDLPLIVSANTNQVGDTYLWSTNQTSPDIEITTIGTYSVTVTSSEGCESTEFFTVTESEAANIVVTENIDFSDPNNVVITVSGIGNYMYQLDDEDPQLSNVFENVSLGFHTLTIIDLNGCASIIKEIVVIDAPKFMTPNGDGHFDTWHITGVETLSGTIIYIFDRFGKLITTLTANSTGWNGFYNGKLMPASDYWYLAKVRKGDIAFEVKGHFSLRL
ncbi:T9SS type B sorting domain-containing protein [Psychroserpens ponticola]|uniref:Choice-of-anchor L domain-containing protein n=1 Tax=Psychroserpens ponticola TaxID=2932268 RepID=A0ABY7RU95_9FLAO|nr:choice-of-anchor L domain-containing protein [Psychroserpens ponticola]WCO00347.1 choice-of-anchor L domain-containing protein [Psychroserpens ponticola]